MPKSMQEIRAKSNAFHIYFFGLICHVGEDEYLRSYAAMVRDTPTHQPKAFFQTNPDTGIAIGACDHIGFELDKIFSPQSEAKTSSAFRRCVPSLKKIRGGTLHPQIKQKAIIVHYPVSDTGPSELIVPQLYSQKGEYLKSGQVRWGPECVAKATELTITSAASKLQVVSFKNNNRQEIGPPLTPGDCVIVANYPMHRHRHPGHAMTYGNLLMGADQGIELRKDEKCTYSADHQAECPWVRDWLKNDLCAPDDLECGNTNWP